MMHLVLKEVTSHDGLMSFIRFPDNLYKGCRYYIPAIHKSQISILSKEKNPAFGHCEARYWLARYGNNVVGRVAGIINHRYNKERDVKYIRFGWIDFTEDQEVLNLLIGAIENWAREKGMEYIHGPLGFTSFDASGVLVDGFEELPTSWSHYNYPYDDRMLKDAGYSKDVDWIEMNIKVPGHEPQREIKIARLIEKRYLLRNASFRTRSEMRYYAGLIFELINSVYRDLYGFSTLSADQIENLVNEFLPLIQADYVSVVLNEKDDAVAFGLVIPSLSKALKKAGGRLSPFTMLRILWALRFNDTVDMLLIGVKPEYRNKGAYALVFEKIFNTMKRNGIRQVESNRELEDNEKVQQLWAGYESRQHKRARCYIKPLL